jgi:NADPH:quinone reductase-like Zn-dependent oxidoreductase/SAM-dependent methyltransferase
VESLASLRRREPERATMFSALGKLYSLGHTIDWRSILPHDAQYLKLPAYPWQRELYWKESERSKQLRLGVGEHPLLGFRTQAAPPTWMLETPAAHLAYLDDHRVRGSAVYPMTAYLEAVAGAVRKLLPDRSFTLENVSIKKAIVFHADQATEIQVVIGADYSSFEVLSRQLEADWESNATGRIHTATSRPVPVTLDLPELRARCQQEIAKDAYYEALHQCGLDYGPCFRGISQLWAGIREAVARIERPRNLEEDRYQIHPALLDSCLQTLMAAASWCWVDGTFNGGLLLPVSLDSIRMYGAPPETIWAHARAVPGTDPRQLRGNVQLLGGDGQLVAELRGVVCQAVGSAPPQRRHRDDLLYHYRWIPRPLQSEGNGCGEMPDPEQIAAIVQPEFSGWAESAQRRRYYEQLKPAMAELCVVYLLEMLDRLGHPLLAGERISTLALTDELGIATQHTKLFGRMIQILAEAGVLAASDGDWVVVGRQERLSATALWRSLFERWPGFLAELTLLRRCGERLAEIVRGTIDPHHILFAPDSAPTLDHAYQDSPTVSLHNRAAARAIQSALARLPGDRPVRILEIGAGTGGSTAHILPVLPQARSQYVFTDVSQQFLSDAAQKFRQYPFVEYRKLDIEIDPVAQVFQEHAFDIVVATDALHATRDLRRTVENIRRLLASEGLLVLIEVTDAPLWFDLVFGTLEGWWLFQDYDLRPSHPLLNPRQWIGLLSEQGFSATGIYDAEEDHAEHTLLLARGPRLQQSRKQIKTPDEMTNGRWLIFADAGGVAESLSHRLAESGCEAILVQAGSSYSRLPHAFSIEPGSSQDMARLVSELHDPSQVWEGIVFLWSLDVPVLDVPALSEGGDRAIEAAQMLACLPLVNLATALGQSRTTVRTGLWIVTSGAQGAGGLNDIRPAQALPWGLGRVLGNELPNLHPRLVDLSPNPSSEEVDGLFEELRYASEEDEIAFRRGTRYVNRLMSGDDESNQPSQADRPQGDRRAFYFEVETPGLVDTLVAVPLRRQPPPPGQVEIAVQAAPLNFRDVAKATGLLTKVNLPIGLECGGVVTAVGDGVTGLRAGDEVIAFASHALASHTTSDARFVARKPAHLNLEEAATALVAFATAHYGLVTCGQVMRGDTVLIHAATGGVGLAAIQVCQAAGAEVLATAGNADKRALLTALGVRHVMDSRSLDFAETVREITGGRGVDIVLNSLGGMAQSKSLSILAPCGRFVELGKRDIEQNTPLEMKHFQNNISFYAVDLDHLLGERPQQTCELIQQVGELLDQGIYRPLPYRVFPLTEAGNAFRFMAQGKHIGKVVISMQGGAPRRWQDASSALRFQENGTYLITGGLGGFSLEVARWMAERGAGCLVLASRSESVPPRRLAGVQAVQQFGSEVRLARCDVTDAAELGRLLAEIRQSSRPLRGIIHAAMVLEDGPVTQMDLEQLTKVIQPKAAGAWNLHRLTIKDPLDFFVMFSSFAALMGNPGQANYAAGNLFLDALAHARKNQGLPALTVDWGALGEIGYVADTPRVAEYVKQLGVILLAPSDAMASFGYLLQSGATQAAVMAVDWDKLSNFASTDKPRFEHIAIQAQKRARGATSSGENGTASVPAAASDADRHGQLEGKLQGEMASLLGTTPSRVDVHVPLNNMGFDSLMAVTARHWIETEFGVDVPAVRFVEGISVRGLSEIILAREAKVVSR